MYEINESVYRRLAELLISEIGLRDFYSDAITLQDGEVECRLLCTAVVRRRNGNTRDMVSIAPVWWELQTTAGCEVLNNDFSFNEMLNHIELN